MEYGLYRKLSVIVVIHLYNYYFITSNLPAHGTQASANSFRHANVPK